ncbi:hypothetical protein HBB16_06945 [Pseudonocardia sp. MCCB 268]|nr:hypothetical protein [Pseudonocardia cytotoxica]
MSPAAACSAGLRRWIVITKTVRWQLIALAVVTLVGVGYAGFRYAGVDRIFGRRRTR